MIYPITIYGDPLLKRKAESINKSYPKLDQLIEDMFETMYFAMGVGLAAPQIGKSIRLFVVDSKLSKEDKSADLKGVFINPLIVEKIGSLCKFEEGCLSIPGIRDEVSRPEGILLRYFDENFISRTEEFHGIEARIIQHEYDHIEGILFTERLSEFKKSLLKRKLKGVSEGRNLDTKYPVNVYRKSRRREGIM